MVSIVNRTLATLDLNPLLINLLNEVTDVVTEVVAAVDSLLGSIVQGNSKINFIIDNLGNIVSYLQEIFSFFISTSFCLQTVLLVVAKALPCGTAREAVRRQRLPTIPLFIRGLDCLDR